MKRFLIGALAFIGALSLLFFAAGAGLALLAAGSKPTVPPSVVLELDLSEPLPEYVLDDSLAGAFGKKPATMHDVLDALQKAGEDTRVKGLVVRVGRSCATR
jgi:protease-4